MAWRFKASKYKNAVPIVPKPENCIRDITVDSYQTYGHNIVASAAFMAFNIGQNGSSLAVLQLDDSGRKGKDMALLHGHTDTVTDMSFSPFHDGLLATGSQDCLIKIWHIPKNGLENSLTDPECVLYSKTQRRVETVLFHPIADCLLSTTSFTVLNLWDVTTQQAVYNNADDHTEVIQCINWNLTGDLVATTCKDKQLRILDCRNKKSVVHETISHQGIKDSRVVWLNDGVRLLTTGFNGARQREVCIRDMRKFNQCEKALELDSSTGILLPLYDPDTNMLFLAGKGDTSIMYMEVTNRDPYLIEGLRHNGEQTKGACLVPKRALNVMQGEVNRILQLTSTMVIPIMYQVPRKTYRDFHSDLYPDTTGCVSDLTPSDWIGGKNTVIPKISLDPSKKGSGDTVLHRGSLQDICLELNKKRQTAKPKTENEKEKEKPKKKESVGSIKKMYEEPPAQTALRNLKPVRPVEKVENQNGENHCHEDETEEIEKPKKIETENDASSKASTGNDVTLKLLAGNVTPPKPMPRSTRSNSIDMLEDRPVAKPRTHKNSIESQPNSLTDFSERDGESENYDNENEKENEDEKEKEEEKEKEKEKEKKNDFPTTIVIEKSQPPVIQSVNPNLPISGGYKPRLGPKPFTPPKLQNYASNLDKLASAEPNSFDKIFSVPQAPQTVDKPPEKSQNNEISNNEADITRSFEKLPTYESEVNDLSKLTENSKIYEKNSLELGKFYNEKKTNDINVNHGNLCEKIENDLDKPLKKVSNLEENVEKKKKVASPVKNGEADDEDYLPKTPSMAERRKLFETGRRNSGSEEKEQTDGVTCSKSVESFKEEDNVLERGGQRNSIAERRRVYESRSVSVQDQGVAVDKTSPTPLRRKGSFKSKHEETSAEEPVTFRAPIGGAVKTEKNVEKKEITTPTPKRTSTVFGRVSKFRHLKGTPGHKSTFIENIKNVSRQVSGECDGFHANCDRVAVPLSGPGGKIAVFELSKTGRLPDVVTPTLVHGTTVMDFCWDNFDNRRLAVACDDGIVRLWIIPEGGLTEPTNEPNTILESHTDKIYCIKFHPLARDILATASYDMTIKIWDLNTMTEKLCLTGHTDQIFCLSWSPCGKFLATACKDGLLRIYNPRQSSTPIRQGKGPVGTRGARVVWALDGAFIVVMGFDKVSERQIMVYKSNDLKQPLTTVGLDVSPAILMPFYDEDSSTLFLTGRGDSTIYTFEVTEESPYVCPLSHHRCTSLHQGLSFLSKKVCDVASVEFARALRLSNNTIEPLSFTVPRIKSELFQDDLFPPTKVTWEPTMTSAEWFGGANKQARRISLQPPNMESLSSLGGNDKTPAKNNSTSNESVSAKPAYNKFGLEFNDVKSKQEQIQKAVSSRMEINLSLEQDHMEGVDEKEWEE